MFIYVCIYLSKAKSIYISIYIIPSKVVFHLPDVVMVSGKRWGNKWGRDAEVGRNK